MYKLQVDFSMHATIPPGVRWGDVEPLSQIFKDLGRVHRRAAKFVAYSSHGSLPLIQGPMIFSSRRISVNWSSKI